MPPDYEQTAAVLIRATEDAVAKAVAPLLKRIEDLESRQLEKGEQGEQGRDGAGVAGALIDRAGNLVLTLTDGSTRDLGAVVGTNGERGEKGEQGDAGERGEDGKDAYPGEARSLYDPEATYRALDVVSFNGSEWRAKKDDPGQLPGDGWMLSASKGKRGEPGQRGERGIDGKPGKDGAQPVGLAFEGDKMQFVMVLDDGNQLEADFEPVARLIVENLRDG